MRSQTVKAVRMIISLMSKKEIQHLLDRVTHEMSIQMAVIENNRVGYSFNYDTLYIIADQCTKELGQYHKKVWKASVPHIEAFAKRNRLSIRQRRDQSDNF